MFVLQELSELIYNAAFRGLIFCDFKERCAFSLIVNISNDTSMKVKITNVSSKCWSTISSLGRMPDS